MPRFSSSAREKLYDAEAAKARAAGKGNLPICVHCFLPVDGVREAWDVAHDPTKPGWLGGDIVGIGHRRCNRLHNNVHDTPLYFKVKRVRQHYIGAKVSSGRPLPGTRASGLKKTMGGRVLDRRTGEPVKW